jgi:hypothetical protein
MSSNQSLLMLSMIHVKGWAHNVLHSIHKAIKTFNYNIVFKKMNIHCQSANAQVQMFMQSLANDKVSAADKYRCACTPLLCLGLVADDNILQPLYDNQLWMKNVNLPSLRGVISEIWPLRVFILNMYIYIFLICQMFWSISHCFQNFVWGLDP